MFLDLSTGLSTVLRLVVLTILIYMLNLILFPNLLEKGFPLSPVSHSTVRPIIGLILGRNYFFIRLLLHFKAQIKPDQIKETIALFSYALGICKIIS